MALVHHEEQRASRRLVVALALLALPAIAIVGFALVRARAPFAQLALVIGLVVAVQGGALAFTRWLRLIVDVHDDALWYRLAPLQRRHRHLRWSEVASHAIAKWSPAARGGWGVRGPARDRVYAMSGNRGVALVLRDGRKLLLGSDDPEALERAIARARAASKES